MSLRTEPSTDETDLPPVAVYFPLAHGRYRVTPDLFAMGRDFGNGAADARVFQIDRDFAKYHANTLEARREDHAKYVCDELLPDALARPVHRFVVERLLAEYPQCFRFEPGRDGIELQCRLTGERIRFGEDFDFQAGASARRDEMDYSSGLDALASQVQEDLAVLSLGEEDDQIRALHLCAPNYWAPREKVGRTFPVVHAPVPGMESLNRKPRPLLEAIVRRGPYVRFAWGLTTDERLNHHPDPPAGVDPAAWAGRRFVASSPRLFLRIERQTLHGFPEIDAALFTIRTYFRDVAGLRADTAKIALLVSAIESMTPAQLRYKGLARDRDAVLRWLGGRE